MSRTSLVLLGVALALASGAPGPARAHHHSAQVDQREGAVAVRLRADGGRPLADAAYAVESPRGGGAPFAEGRTDRHGWLAFTPDVPGTWTVRIADATGHGETVTVQVAKVAGAASASASEPQGGTIALTVDDERRGISGGTRGAGAGSGYLLRALAGLTAIVVVFRVLLAVQRARRGKAR